MKVLSVVGNRPQFVKSGPLSIALRERGIDEVVVHTGQHYDRELSAVFFEELGLHEPEYRLDLHTADPDAMEPAIAAAVADERPDWVLVFGDTNSTLAGARAAASVEFVSPKTSTRSGRSAAIADAMPGCIAPTSRDRVSRRYAGSGRPSSS